jgi:hypothetical protein
MDYKNTKSAKRKPKIEQPSLVAAAAVNGRIAPTPVFRPSLPSAAAWAAAAEMEEARAPTAWAVAPNNDDGYDSYDSYSDEDSD